jgi:isopenicillin-N epimerase
MPSALAHHWSLEPGIAFLNHGSFGATPRPVLEAQRAWQTRIESEPVRFFSRDLNGLLDEARVELATFIDADADDLAFVPNATTGFNTVLQALRFERGDELLSTDHAYNAAKNAMDRVAARSGARVVIASVPFPISSAGAVVDAVLAHATSRTRLALLDHVTSPTAIIFPIEDLISELASQGIDTLVDGAHGPGMLDLHVAALGAAYYTGNLHKWVCAPKGAGFLWIRRDHRDAIRPLVISHGANAPGGERSLFRLEFDWTGTADPSAYLSVSEAIRFGASLLPGGWPALRARNHALTLIGRDLVCRALNVLPPIPDGLLGSMASIPLPGTQTGGQVQGIDLYGDPVHDALLEEDAIQVVTTPWPQRPDGGPWQRLLRLSAAAYNDVEDYERLAAALPGVLAATSQGPASSPHGN